MFLLFAFLASFNCSANQALLEHYLIEKGLIGAVAGWVTPSSVSLWSAGYQDLRNFTPVEKGTARWRLASLSKSITATLAIRLEAKGVLSLDTPIQNYYPAYRLPQFWMQPVDPVTTPNLFIRREVPRDTVLTLRHLLSNTSGYAFYSDGFTTPTPPRFLLGAPFTRPSIEEALSYWIGGPLLFLPGQALLYTTFGFNLAGVVLEHATGKSFESLLEEEITQPLSITTLAIEHVEDRNFNFVHGYRRDSSFNLIEEPMSEIGWKAPGGGLSISGPDMARLCQGWMDDRFLSPELREKLWSPTQLNDGTPTSYGLGFWLKDLDYVFHDGEQEGTSTRFQIDRDQQHGCFFILTNTKYSGLKHENFLNQLEASIFPAAETIESPVE